MNQNTREITNSFPFSRRITAILLFCLFGLFFTSQSALAETSVYYYTLTGSSPYIETAVTVNKGDSLRIRQWGSAALYPPGRTVPWVATGGDPGCVAGTNYTLPGVNCWSLIARVGGNNPFLVGSDWEGSISGNGKLFVGINHALPFNASGSFNIQVIHNPVPLPLPPEPFLAVPWEYNSAERTFEDVILEINSYFDHEYPLLSVNYALDEPIEVSETLTNYEGVFRSNRFNYSSHDGYDYGRDAGSSLGTPVLAAASGCATYYSCGPCGNTIRIDHGNHYQTRYLHLQKTDLITTNTNSCIPVSQGEKIGLVGYSGRTLPPGEGGAHLHFMVVEDKNRDGNFDDNIPDGVTDPFGWQSSEDDPWPAYEFSFKGEGRTGNDSHYLWQTPLSTLDQSLPTNGGVFEHKQLKLDILPNSVAEKATVFIQSQPFQFILDTLSPIGSIFEIVLKNLFGTPITTLSTPAIVTVSFTGEDLNNVDLNHALIYSSSDGISWAPHETTIDPVAKTAQAATTHFSFFTLAAPRLDSQPPETSALFNKYPIFDTTYELPVNISLAVTDASPSAGPGHTFYRLNDDDWQLFTDPIEATQAGDYTLHYYSSDAVDNVEPFKTASFSAVIAPAAPPEISLALSPDFSTVVVSSNDAQTLLSTESLGKFLERFTLTSANETTTRVTAQKTKFLFVEIWRLKDVSYANADPQVLNNNSFSISRVKKPRSSTYVTIGQTLKLGSKTISLTYDVAANTTKIIERQRHKKIVSQTRTGFVPLTISTNQGKVVYNY